MTFKVFKWPDLSPAFEGDKAACKEFIQSQPAEALPFIWVEDDAENIIHEPNHELIRR
jgi:hypothetical protein